MPLAQSYSKVGGGPLRLAFDGVEAIFEVPRDDEFGAAFEAALRGWPHREADTQSTPFAAVSLEADASYSLSCDGMVQRGLTAVGAVCSFVVALANRQVAETPGRLCFHGAAVSIDGRLVLIPGRRRAGKSTLVARLAAGGATVLGDDIVPLDMAGRAVALGVASRLRLPLPEGADERFRGFVEGHISATDGYYAYLDLPPPMTAPRGTGARADAILLLDRKSRAKARLTRAPAALALKILARQNVAYNGDARPLLKAMEAMASRLPVFVLTYADLEQAAGLLRASFGRWQELLSAAPVASNPALLKRLLDPVFGETPRQQRLDGARLVQRRDVELRIVDGEAFLAGAGEAATLCHLDPLGAAIWHLLAEPVTPVEAAEVVCGAFPGIDPKVVRRDVARLLRQLAAGGLVVRPLHG